MGSYVPVKGMKMNDAYEINHMLFILFSSQETPVEFFGVPFDDGILYEARFIGTDGILTACSGVLHDIGKRDIYSNHLDLASKISEGHAMKSFLIALSRLPQDDQQKCFDAIVGKLEEGGTGMCNVKNRLEKGIICIF